MGFIVKPVKAGPAAILNRICRPASQEHRKRKGKAYDEMNAHYAFCS